MIEIIKSFGLNEIKRPPAQHVATSFFLLVYLRALGLAILGVAILLWMRVLGYQSADIQQTFNANEYLAILLAVLAVVTPLLGVGLWLDMRWARVLGLLLGAGLIGLYYSGQPISYEVYICARTFMILLMVYYLGHLWPYFMLVLRKKTKSKITSN